MSERRILRQRISALIDHNYVRRYLERSPLTGECTFGAAEPVPYTSIDPSSFRPIAAGERWGTRWQSAWFRFRGTVPGEWRGRKVGALLDVGGEAWVRHGRCSTARGTCSC
jgi:alpha-mannosidase